MNRIPKVSDTEWEVMRIVWAKHPLTAAEIIDRLLADDPTWHPKTVRTLLTRLVQKRALDYEPEGRSYVYKPLVTERQCIADASDSFLDRVFGGSLKPMLAHFVEERRLSRKDIDDLRHLLDNPSKEEPKKSPKKNPKR